MKRRALRQTGVVHLAAGRPAPPAGILPPPPTAVSPIKSYASARSLRQESRWPEPERFFCRSVGGGIGSLCAVGRLAVALGTEFSC